MADTVGGPLANTIQPSISPKIKYTSPVPNLPLSNSTDIEMKSHELAKVPSHNKLGKQNKKKLTWHSLMKRLNHL